MQRLNPHHDGRPRPYPQPVLLIAAGACHTAGSRTPVTISVTVVVNGRPLTSTCITTA